LECRVLSCVRSRPVRQRNRQIIRCGPRHFRYGLAVAAPKFTEADFTDYRRHRAFDAWKRAMWDAGSKLPTQVADRRARCFCDAKIGIADMNDHIYAVHMEPKAA
jgi:hypothetical protein